MACLIRQSASETAIQKTSETALCLCNRVIGADNETRPGRDKHSPGTMAVVNTAPHTLCAGFMSCVISQYEIILSRSRFVISLRALCGMAF